MAENIFQDFQAVSKEEWLVKVEKDLKGKPLSDLDWMVGDMKIPPFYHSSDLVSNGALSSDRANNDWEIGEDIHWRNTKEANKAALEGLMGGVNATVFHFSSEKNDHDLRVLLDQIELPYISIHFRGDLAIAKWKDILNTIAEIAEHRAYDVSTLKGSVNLKIISFEEIQDLLSHPLSGWKLLQLELPYTAKEESAEVLAHGLLQAYELLDTTPIDQRVAVLDRLMIRVAIGASYFVEIAKLRALSILWANLAKAYGLEQGLPDLEVVLAEASHDKNENTNMIRSTTQAMSAIIGGANRLIVRSASKECNTFTRRIARNVQHLLKMESYLDRVVDPAAGSYYIEALTTQLAQKAWDIFQSKL